MAKKIKDVETFDIQGQILKDYGAVLRPANAILERKRKIFSTGSPALDLAMKGIPEGSTVLLSGPKKCGKTTTALQILSEYQKQDRETFVIDAECRFKEMNLQIHGLDGDKLTHISSTRDKILDGNDLLQITSNIMKAIPGSAILFDSSSAVCARDRVGEQIQEKVRLSNPNLWAEFCRQNAPIINSNDITLIIIQHLITNTSGGPGRKFYEDSGTKLGYLADIQLRCEWFEKLMIKDVYAGQILHWNVVTSALTSPVEKVDSYIRFGYGIDSERETFILGVDYGLVSKAGSWFTLEFMDKPEKFQGEDSCVEFLRNNPVQLELLKAKLHETLS